TRSKSLGSACRRAAGITTMVTIATPPIQSTTASTCAARAIARSVKLDGLRHHLDRAAGAFGSAQAAALAIVVVELEALARPELDHRVVGAHAVAVVALEAVAARQAAARLEERAFFVEAAQH